MSRTLHVAGLANARDLGGLERNDGTVTPTGTFVRSESLDRVRRAGWETLHARGIRTVIDLRRPDERTVAAPAGFAQIRVDLDGSDRAFWAQYETDGRWATPLYYLAHLQELPHRLGAVLSAVAAADSGGILFHCAAGWDRTGLVAAVLLRALDVTADAAVADYLLSFSNASAMSKLHGRSFEADARHAILSRFGHTAESAFRDMYQNLDLSEWFARAGVDPATRASIETWRGRVRYHDL